MRKRDLWIIGAAVALALGVGWHIFFGSAMETGAWGLHFYQEGAPPTGSQDAARLRDYDAVYMGDPEEKVLYLTFDAGYENGFTASILDTLKAHQVPAAFFLVGNYIEKNPDLVNRMVREGHTVGNHTMHHPDMSRCEDKTAFGEELKQLEALYRQTTGTQLPRYYRPPQGIFSQENLRHAKELGYRTVFWSLAHVDWKNDAQPEPEQAVQKLLKRTHNGAVVLLHSTSGTNAQILGQLLARWKEMGYRFGSLNELFEKA